MDYQPQKDFLHNRTILVTGAGDGIGREAALAYARHGARVLLLGRTTEKLDTVKQEIDALQGPNAHCFTFDLLHATEQNCAALADKIKQICPTLDGLLNNASILGVIEPTATYPVQTWLDVMQVNLNGTFMLTQALLPLLLNGHRPSLIFTSSSVGRQGRIGWGAYSVSKFATEGMMQVLAAEHQKDGLRVNTIDPGGTRTGMRASAFPDENSLKLKTAEEIMGIYLYLMGDDSLGETGKAFSAQPNRTPGAAK